MEGTGGGNVESVAEGAFANMGNIIIILRNSYVEYGENVFTGSNPIIVGPEYGSELNYCRDEEIPYFYLP